MNRAEEALEAILEYLQELEEIGMLTDDLKEVRGMAWDGVTQ